MTLVGKALALAADVHRNQVDKAGEPYMLHPIAVMERATDLYLSTGNDWQLEKIQAAALLHDAIEDIDPESSWDVGRLRDRIYELDNRVYQAVDCLTKYKPVGDYKEPYEVYLERVASDWMSRIVKIADLSHNLDAFRIPTEIGEKDFERWNKYHRAVVYLTQIQESRPFQS